MKKCFVVLFSLVLSAACSISFDRGEGARADSTANENAVQRESTNIQVSAITENNSAESMRQSINLREEQNANVQTKADCLKNRRGEKVPDARQTFILDFEPFRGDCFVTFHEPEYTNPALGAEFYIYRSGKPIFEFPSQLNGATCWVDAVSFVDLNGDQLKDIIIVGLCGAKAGAYNQNMVYANTGEGFKTNENANYKLDDFKKIREIENFVRRSQKLFFK